MSERTGRTTVNFISSPARQSSGKSLIFTATRPLDWSVELFGEISISNGPAIDVLSASKLKNSATWCPCLRDYKFAVKIHVHHNIYKTSYW